MQLWFPSFSAQPATSAVVSSTTYSLVTFWPLWLAARSSPATVVSRSALKLQELELSRKVLYYEALDPLLKGTTANEGFKLT